MTQKRPKPFDFDRFRRYVLECVADIGKTFTKPDDDWRPLLVMVAGKRVQIVLLLDLFRDETTKSLGEHVLVEMFLKFKPDLAALINSAWTVHISQDDPLAETTMEMCRQFGVSNHPNRVEIVNVLIAGLGQEEGWNGLIQRSPDKPPALGVFNKSDRVDGRVVGWLRAAFQSIGKVEEQR